MTSFIMQDVISTVLSLRAHMHMYARISSPGFQNVGMKAMIDRPGAIDIS